MQSLSASSIIGRAGRVASRWWVPALARRDAPVLMASASANPNQHLDLLFRHKNQISKLDRPRLFSSSAFTQAMNEAETKEAADEKIHHMRIMPGHSHPYGYRTRYEVKTAHCFDIADRTETQAYDPACGFGLECDMMQIFSLKLARTPTGSGPVVQLYGYVAARDEVDYKLIYVFNRGRDDPITVRQGSLIEMTGPKRCIALSVDALMEFDMRIKNGDREDDDLQLIQGVSFFHRLHMPCKPQKVRFDGGCGGGAVDMSFADVDPGVEALVDVVVSEVQTGLDLTLSSTLSFEEAGEFVQEEFQLYRGAVIGESCGLRRFAIAVRLDTEMHLKLKIGHEGSDNDIEHNCSFKAQRKGDASHQINLDLASILVKVTWATLPV